MFDEVSPLLQVSCLLYCPQCPPFTLSLRCLERIRWVQRVYLCLWRHRLWENFHNVRHLLGFSVQDPDSLVSWRCFTNAGRGILMFNPVLPLKRRMKSRRYPHVRVPTAEKQNLGKVSFPEPLTCCLMVLSSCMSLMVGSKWRWIFFGRTLLSPTSI